MPVQQNISLKPFNTFGIDAMASSFATFSGTDELNDLLTENLSPDILILGGGSNILFTKNYDGLVLKNEIRGIEELYEDRSYVYVKAGAGENWHQFILHCINNNWAGVENLSLIPGNVGAAPIQNIGAYGVEFRDVFQSLEAFHLYEKKLVTFTLSDCEFGYRESVFKKKYKNQFVILNITFRLHKEPIFHIDYGSLKQELEKMKVQVLTIQAISQAVINIRSSKLPDPAKIGNAGSFFKNPKVSVQQFTELKNKFDEMPSFPSSEENFVKVPAGWLVEQCGWKGFRKGDAGCYSKQALVLVNYGNARGRDIYDLSEEILLSVKEKFGIELEREVNII